MQYKFSQVRINIIVLILIPLISCAQTSTEFFSLSYSRTTPGNFDRGLGSVTGANLEINLITPTIKFGKRTNLNNLFNYKLEYYNFNQVAQEARGYPKRLTNIQYSVLLRQELNEQWTFWVLPQVTARSDFEQNFSANDLFPAISMIGVQKSKKYKQLEIGYGISYSRDYFKNTVTPLFAIFYVSSQLRLEALLPIRVQFVLTPNQFWEYGLEVNLNTAIYRSSTFDSEVKYVRAMDVPINAILARKIVGMLWAKAEIGTILSRQYDVMDKDYRVIKDQTNTIDPTLYASIGISLRLKD